MVTSYNVLQKVNRWKNKICHQIWAGLLFFQKILAGGGKKISLQIVHILIFFSELILPAEIAAECQYL